MAKKEIACAINPICGDLEYYNMDRGKASKSFKIAIVGGGPGGMETARWAKIKGHKPTIFEKTAEMGGAILGCCIVPGKEKMKWEADWLRNEMRDLKVDIKMNHVPTFEELKKFDVVVNATGAVSYVPEVTGHKEKIVSFEEAMACPKSTCEFYPKGSERKNRKLGEKVIVWGDHYAAADLVAFLGAAGKDVTVITDRKEFGSSVEVIHMYVLRKRMAQGDAEALNSRPYKFPVKVLQSSSIYEVREKEAVIIDARFNRTIVPFDDIVTCYTKSNTDFDETKEKLEAEGIPVFTIGDAKSPRNLHAAVKEGADFIVKILDRDLLIGPNGAIAGNLPPDVRMELGFDSVE